VEFLGTTGVVGQQQGAPVEPTKSIAPGADAGNPEALPAVTATKFTLAKGIPLGRISYLSTHWRHIRRRVQSVHARLLTPPKQQSETRTPSSLASIIYIYIYMLS